MRVILPTLVTIIGAIVGLFGVALLPSPLAMPFLFASVGIDVCDGALARWLHVETRIGAILDWTVDTALSYGIVYRLAMGSPVFAAVATGVLIGVQSAASYEELKFSGRTAVTVMAMWWLL